ncbi:ABC transporter substrate-binding protein [Flindersiella endophytica]
MTGPMTGLSRRRFLQGTGLLAGGLAGGLSLGACSTGPDPSSGGGRESGALQWWDHFNPLQDLHKEVFAKFQKETGIAVEYTPQQTGKMGQALQLAKQSHQLPDVMSNVGLQVPIPALIKDNWFQPIQLSKAALDALPENALVDGIHKFDGKVYSFPIFSFRQYQPATWFNKEYAEKAGLDPESPPETYEEFRAAAKAIQKSAGDNVYGWILGLGQPPRLAEQINGLAQGAGFEGTDGQLFRTGEFAYHDDTYVNAIEFWLSMKKDGLMVPGTETFVDKATRARWAAGVAGYYLDGPWCPGVVVQDLASFTDKLGVGPMLVPEKGTQVTGYRGPSGGAFFCSGESKRAKDVSKLLSMLTTPDYYTGLAANMDQPPLDASAVDRADVHPTYKKVVGWFQDAVFLAPVAVVKQPDISKVNAEMKPIDPDLGTTVQGLFSGHLKDVRKSLKDLSDRSQKARETALAAAKQKGAEVELDDWAFPDWKPRQDYTLDMYK